LPIISVGSAISSTSSKVTVKTVKGQFVLNNYQGISFSSGDQCVIFAPVENNEFATVLGKTS